MLSGTPPQRVWTRSLEKVASQTLPETSSYTSRTINTKVFSLPTGYPKAPFVASTLLAALSGVVLASTLQETLPVTDRRPFRLRQSNPLSCLRLLNPRLSSTRMVLLNIMALLAVMPMVMGDVLILMSGRVYGMQAQDVAVFFMAIGMGPQHSVVRSQLEVGGHSEGL